MRRVRAILWAGTTVSLIVAIAASGGMISPERIANPDFGQLAIVALSSLIGLVFLTGIAIGAGSRPEELENDAKTSAKNEKLVDRALVEEALAIVNDVAKSIANDPDDVFANDLEEASQLLNTALGNRFATKKEASE